MSYIYHRFHGRLYPLFDGCTSARTVLYHMSPIPRSIRLIKEIVAAMPKYDIFNLSKRRLSEIIFL